MFFYELFIGLPVRATLNQELLSIYVKKAKWQTELSGRLADRFGSRLKTTTKSLIAWSYWRYIFAE